VQTEEKQNEELLTISNQILETTKAIHALAATAVGGDTETDPPTPG
jgi:hypothetical protein